MQDPSRIWDLHHSSQQCRIVNPLSKDLYPTEQGQGSNAQQWELHLHFSRNYFFLSFCFLFLGLHPQHMELPGIGVKLELQMPAYTTATARPDPSLICNLHHSSLQCQILNPLSKARDRTHVFMDTSQVHYC